VVTSSLYLASNCLNKRSHSFFIYFQRKNNVNTFFLPFQIKCSNNLFLQFILQIVHLVYTYLFVSGCDGNNSAIPIPYCYQPVLSNEGSVSSEENKIWIVTGFTLTIDRESTDEKSNA